MTEIVKPNKLKRFLKGISKGLWWTFRLLNLHEPDLRYPVISLSKLSIWMTLGLTMYVVSTQHSIETIGAALIANLGAIGQYAYRRRMQVQTRTGGYGYGGYDYGSGYDGYQGFDPNGGINAATGGNYQAFGPAAGEMPFESEPHP